MTRVCHVITTLEVGGAQIQLSRLVRGLQARGVENLVVSLGDSTGLGQELGATGIPVAFSDMRRGSSLLALRKVFRAVRRFQPQVIDTWLYHADLLGPLLGIAARAPVVWNLRNSYLGPHYYTPRKRVLLRSLALLSPATAAIVSNSKSAEAFHRKAGYRCRRWQVIPNGYDLDLLRPSPSFRPALRRRLGLPEGSVLFGMLARWDPVKGHDLLLQAMANVVGTRRDVHLALFGDGLDAANEAVSDRIASFGLFDNVHLMGPTDDIVAAINGLDFSVSSSLGESFPNSVAESLACGVPVVSTDVGNVAVLLKDAGILVPPNDANSLGSAMLQAAALSVDERKVLAERGRRTIVDGYSASALVDRYAALFGELSG